VGGRGGFEEEVEDGCGRLTDKVAAAPSKKRRSQKRDKVTANKLTVRIMSQYFTYIFKPCM
jgi:hypothetical protein